MSATRRPTRITSQLATRFQLRVLDMYQHSYALDSGAAAAKYVDAFFGNLRWDEVERRYALGRAMLERA